mgnify:CR=1 FL=1
MVTRFVIKDAHVPAGIVETMERRIHQRMDAYFKDEAEGDTVISVRITEQKNTYKVEMTMPYMGHTLRTDERAAVRPVYQPTEHRRTAPGNQPSAEGSGFHASEVR